MNKFYALLFICLLIVPVSSQSKSNKQAKLLKLDQLTTMGPVGIECHVRNDIKSFVVTEVDPKGPAKGVLRKDDVIVKINDQQPAKWTTHFNKDEGIMFVDQIMFLSDMIEESEGDPKLKGKMTFSIKKSNGKIVNKIVKLEKLGYFSETYPFNCPKSHKIVMKGIKQRYKFHTAVTPPLTGLLYLANSEHGYASKAKSIAKSLKINVPSNYKDLITKNVKPKLWSNSWASGYRGLFLAEYYHQTKDKKIAEYLEWRNHVSAHGQHQSYWGWNHGFNKSNEATSKPGYAQMVFPTAMILGWWSMADRAGIPIWGDRYNKLHKRFDKILGGSGQFAYDIGADCSGTSYGPLEGKAAGRSGLTAMAHMVGGRTDLYHLRVKESSASFLAHIYKMHGSHKGLFDGHGRNIDHITWSLVGLSAATQDEYRSVMDYYKPMFNLWRRYDGSFMMPYAKYVKGKEEDVIKKSDEFSVHMLLALSAQEKNLLMHGKEVPFIISLDEKRGKISSNIKSAHSAWQSGKYAQMDKLLQETIKDWSEDVGKQTHELTNEQYVVLKLQEKLLAGIKKPLSDIRFYKEIKNVYRLNQNIITYNKTLKGIKVYDELVDPLMKYLLSDELKKEIVIGKYFHIMMKQLEKNVNKDNLGALKKFSIKFEKSLYGMAAAVGHEYLTEEMEDLEPGETIEVDTDSYIEEASEDVEFVLDEEE